MTEQPPFELPQACLRDLIAWFKAAKVKGVIIGGIAASILGQARFTRDVDALVLVDEEDWPDFMTSSEPFGFTSRVSDALEFAAASRVLLLKHEPTGMEADITLGLLPFEREVIKRAKPVTVSKLKLPLPTAADLIIMKAVAHRPQDMVDVERLLDLNPRASLPRIRRWVEEFAEVMEQPDIVTSLEAIIAKLKERKKKKKKKSNQ